MFTGIIHEIGKVHSVTPLDGGVTLIVEAVESSKELNVNDSIAVNGVCQTVVAKRSDRFTVVAVEETLAKTTLGNLKAFDRVNLELPLRLGDRLGGHLVSGHVDCVGEVHSIIEKGASWLFKVLIPQEFHRYVIPAGSIAIDGVSLTVASADDNSATVSIIPHTMDNTIFSQYVSRTRVNLEFDMIGKYIERQLRSGASLEISSGISYDQLKAWGYDV